MSNRRWTKEEDDQLRANYGKEKLTTRDAATIFGRTLNAIHMRAIRLGLRVEPEVGARNPSWILMQRACADGKPRTVAELALILGMTNEGVAYVLRQRRKDGLAHVADYKKVRGRYRQFWLPVPGEDAPEPDPNPEFARHRRYAAKKREKAREERQATPVAASGVPARHELMTALFGTGAAA